MTLKSPASEHASAAPMEFRSSNCGECEFCVSALLR